MCYFFSFFARGKGLPLAKRSNQAISINKTGTGQTSQKGHEDEFGLAHGTNKILAPFLRSLSCPRFVIVDGWKGGDEVSVDVQMHDRPKHYFLVVLSHPRLPLIHACSV